jgi:L-iditol 2-dehydrogenase
LEIIKKGSVKMLQAKLVTEGEFTLEEVEVPEINKDQVLIKVEKCGICGSDMHTYHGKHPFVKPPLVLGHEFAGTISKIGSEVGNQFKLGQRVAVEPSIVCGECRNCRDGRYNICDHLSVIGCLTDGAFTEYIAISGEKVVPIEDTMSFEDGAMLEPLSVGIHGVERGNIKAGNKVLVIGAGTIGLLLAQAAKAYGAEVAIMDLIDYRLELAKDLGVDKSINSKTQNLEEELNKFAPEGVDVIFECVGNPHTIRKAIEIARKGIRIVVLGVVDEEVLIPISIIQDRELELVGDLMFTRKDYEKAKDLITTKKINLKPLQTKTFPLTEVKTAFEYIINNKDTAIKVFLKP